VKSKVYIGCGHLLSLKTGTITGPHALPQALQAKATEKPELHIDDP
jgi:hypothetical protein